MHVPLRYVGFGSLFSLILSENTQNVHFREAKFRNFPGSMPPGPPPPPPRCTRAFGARSCFRLTNSELLPLGMLLPMGNTISQYNITYLVTQNIFHFSLEKGAPSILYRDIYFKDCWHEVRSSLKCTSSPKKLRTYAPENRSADRGTTLMVGVTFARAKGASL